MLDVKELSVTAKNGQELLHQITLQIEVGQAVGLTGQSGAGKTTLSVIVQEICFNCLLVAVNRSLD